MHNKFKTAALEVLNIAGCFRLTNVLYRRKIRVLAYHRFGPEYVASREFERQIQYLRKNYNLVDLKYLIEIIKRRMILPPNSVIITVDDGYQDFYTEAFPIIKKYSIPVTLFLTVDFIDRKIWLWHDLLNFAIKNTSRSDFVLEANYFDLRQQSDRYKLKLLLDNICTSCTISERDTFIEEILKELDVSVPQHPAPDYAPLTWRQISEMSEYGISYGAHTCTHPILSKMSPSEALREIQESKRCLEEVLQEDILAFCYPNGKEADFNENIKLMIGQCGYVCAFSMIYGMNDLKSERYALKRMSADTNSFVHFLQDVSGFGVLRNSLSRLKSKYS